MCHSTYHGICIEVREQLPVVHSSLLPCFWASTVYSKLTWQQVSQRFSWITIAILELQMCPTASGFLCGLWNLNSSWQACTASAFAHWVTSINSLYPHYFVLNVSVAKDRTTHSDSKGWRLTTPKLLDLAIKVWFIKYLLRKTKGPKVCFHF